LGRKHSVIFAVRSSIKGVGILVAAAMLAGLAPLFIASARAVPASPTGRTLFVTANLQEGYKHGDDLANLREMKIFVRRLLDKTPYQPDVLLLQEVRRRSAAKVARLLSRKTGHRYFIAFGGLRAPVVRSRVLADTAIVLNKSTMERVGDGGWITTRSDRGVRKKHSWGIARRKGSTMTFPMVSVHAGGYRVKRASEKIADELASKRKDLATGRFNVIGGDFNEVRRRYSSGSYVSSAFWTNLTTAPHNYRDSLYVVGAVNSNAVDYIFAKAGIHQAKADNNYHPRTAQRDPSKFYSDHRFRWAVVGSDTTSPSRPTNLRAQSVDQGVRLTWNPSTDRGDSASLRYEVWRIRKNTGPGLLGTVADTGYLHTDVYHSITYRYYVVAVDGAHNRSRRTDTITITHKRT
jgi:Endonuclease/Exonuclease/phosphatase family